MTVFTISDFQDHVNDLAFDLECDVNQAFQMPGMMFVEYEPPMIEGPIIQDEKDYFVMLHELGHVALGHTQGRPPHRDKTFYFDNGVLRSEAEAWEFALDAALPSNPSPETRTYMWDTCLRSYYSGLKAWGWGRPGYRLGNGNRHHVAFAPDEPDEFFWQVKARIQEGG